MELINRSGQCLCGSVKVTAKTAQNFSACHCSMCRAWGGGPFLSVECDEVVFDGQQNITHYDSSSWAERGFCQKCGTHLFYHLKGGPKYFLPVGIFKEGGPWVFDHQIFVDEKPAAYDFANKTKNMTGAEVFAQFAPPEQK